MNRTLEPTLTKHAASRAQQRGIPPLIEQWLDEFGDEEFDGKGAVLIYFSRKSMRAMQRAFGREPIRRMSEYLDAYKVESSHDGRIITVGHRSKRMRRR